MALNMRKVARNPSINKEYLRVVQNGNKRSAGIDAGGKAHEADPKDAEPQIERRWSGEAFQFLARPRCVW